MGKLVSKKAFLLPPDMHQIFDRIKLELLLPLKEALQAAKLVDFYDQGQLVDVVEAKDFLDRNSD